MLWRAPGKIARNFKPLRPTPRLHARIAFRREPRCLPSVNYNTQVLYTQGNGPGNGVRFIANNAVHEYVSQGNAHEVLDLASVSNFRRASAAAAVARARAEIASRGLIVTVVQNYYAVAAAQQKLQSAQKTADEATVSSSSPRTLNMAGKWLIRTSSKRNCRCRSAAGKCRKPSSDS